MNFTLLKTTIVNTISKSSKKQKTTINKICSSEPNPQIRYQKCLEVLTENSRNSALVEMITVFQSCELTDAEIDEIFPSKGQFILTEQMLSFINDKVYRNRDGNFRLIPQNKSSTVIDIPIDGLEADESIIAGKLIYEDLDGKSQTFFKTLQSLEYDGSEPTEYKSIESALRRINIINSYSKPYGFYKEGDVWYRNVAAKMGACEQSDISTRTWTRLVFLMYLCAGGVLADTQALYNVIHHIVKYPQSHTGYVVYINDFDSGGNGKSKFSEGVLMKMFGDSATSFNLEQIRFTMPLLGKRLVSVPEFDMKDNRAEVISMLKRLTGRDTFEYEAKGQTSIVSKSYQNFIVTSNHYVMFDDAGLIRRLQNFQSSNLLHLITYKYVRNQNWLDDFFGDEYTSDIISTEMSNALYTHIMQDKHKYVIPLRNQPVVLSSLKNPILRKIFTKTADDLETAMIDMGDGVSALNLRLIAPDAKPEQYNYAASTLIKWIPLEFTVSRDGIMLQAHIPIKDFAISVSETLNELDITSRQRRSSMTVTLELGNVLGVSIKDALAEFIMPTVEKYSIPYKIKDNHFIIGDFNASK